jgi:hypothetical protein
MGIKSDPISLDEFAHGKEGVGERYIIQTRKWKMSTRALA